MALQTQGGTRHNQLLGTRIPHPPSTNFDEDEFQTPRSKRLKRAESIDSSLSRQHESEDDATSLANVTPSRREIPDSEAETEKEDEGTSRFLKTDLEAALPPVKTDKEAIAEYEAARAAEAYENNLHGRLGQRKWVPGKSSIYVDAFNLALETVLEDEAYLFDAAEMALFNIWRDLSCEGQYLSVALGFSPPNSR